jgi:glycine cleavage system H protein
VSNPEQCRFAKSHEWLAPDGTIGISDHAQKEITDVVFVELPKVGRDVKAGEAVAVVESVKAAFDIYAPVSGKIKKVNGEVSKNPGIVNKAPYAEGWLFSVERSVPDEETKLMTHKDYQNFLESDEH